MDVKELQDRYWCVKPNIPSPTRHSPTSLVNSIVETKPSQILYNLLKNIKI